MVLLTFCACYPYLPGEYDGLAVTLSLVARAGALAGLLLVPIGVLWLALEVRHRRYLAIGAACGYLTVAAVVTVVAWVSSGLTFACVMLALSAYGLPRLVPPAQSIDAGLMTPLRLTVVPLATFLLQVLLADPLAEFSRGRAIASSASLIDDIERYRAAGAPEQFAGRQGWYAVIDSPHPFWKRFRFD